MPFADVNGVSLFYTDEGRGDPPILLVHGWTCDSLDWSWQVDAFADRHRVIAADMRGHGRSSRADGYALTSFAQDLADLLDRLEAGPVVVIGHSMGGAIAAILAVEHPEHVRAVVAVDAATGLDPKRRDVASAFDEALSGPGANEFLAKVWVDMEGPSAVAGFAAWHRRRMLGHSWEFVAETWKAQDEAGLMWRPEADEYLARRECPVLTIYVSPDEAEWEAKLLRHPKSRSIAWPGCGHWFHQERAPEFNRLVLDWIGGF